jgi:S-adenosyl-L-methionine methyltransferase
MSRLDSFITRMQAQRDGLNFLKEKVERLAGPILEIGLGNGRSYDHLRQIFPGRDIYVFERKVAAHPNCIPPDDRLFTGDVQESLPRAARQLGTTAALVHTDLGTGEHEAHLAMGAWLGPCIDRLVGPGGYVYSNQPLEVARWEQLPNPPGVPAGRYYLYRAR